MSNSHGDHIWYELLTDDAEGAAKFYADVIGLTAKDSGMDEGPPYWLLSAPDGTEVAGMMELDDDMKAGGARPVWLGYVAVNDVDASAEKVKDAGGSLMFEPRDIPGVGRFAMVADPHGAPFYIMRGSEEEASHPFASERKPGFVGWNELGTPDIDKSMAFYEAVCSWSKGERMEMPDGPYQMFNQGDAAIGGMMNPGESFPPVWNYYWWSDGVEAAAERTKDAGGEIMFGPHEIPGGDVIIFGMDPQKAVFCLVGPR